MVFSPAKNQSGFKKVLILTGLIIIVYFSAINREQPLLWLMSALLLASLVSGLLWPYWVINRLTVSRTGPTRASEGETIELKVKISNFGWAPRFMIEVIDTLPFLNNTKSSTAIIEKTLGVVAYIGANSTQHFVASIVCEKRGYYQLGPIKLTSSFPLGLKEISQSKKEGSYTLTIYPDLFPIISLPLIGSPEEIHRGDVFLPEGSGVAEFSGLREYRRGDNPRHIHWLTTARLNDLMIMEFEPMASASLYIAMDLSKHANVGSGKYASFEYAVRIVCSISRYACHKNIPVQLYGEANSSINISMASGEGQFQKILDAMAIVEADGAIAYTEILHLIVAMAKRLLFFYLNQKQRLELH